ncbi:2-aminoethylphosphonate--pyruvate transaminase [Staphylococcus epidermidis]|nr:2-aminoethylphosphonate--pyruvate transaminase [Staphylococcus epidermidis]
MEEYKLLTPGPLTTSNSVKETMLKDRCTWDNDYKELTQQIRQDLLQLAQASEEDYTVILQQGSGSFVVESVLQTALSNKDHVLIISNGAYGKRIAQMTERIGKNYTHLALSFDKIPNIKEIEDVLNSNDTISHIAFVHCETTTGILNPLEDLSELAHRYNKKIIVDAMSSFGGVEINVGQLNIDYLISSANKCIQGVPGFGFVISKTTTLAETKGNASSLSLDLYEQWQVMDVNGKWRYTSPTHVVAAFKQAIDELHEEGGIKKRSERYYSNNRYIRKALAQLGFTAYIDEEWQSPIITTYLYPNKAFDFNHFYELMKKKGFVLYPGKLMETPSFRIGNIGELYREDFETLVKYIKEYMNY